MRTTEDLERITPLVWQELTTLGIPFIRCGVFIIDEADNSVQAFLSTPDGRSLGAMRIPVHADKDTAETVAHWKRSEVYRTHWDKKQFLEFMKTMTDLGQVQNQKKYQGAEQPPETLYLHFVPFTQGMIYVGNVEPLAEDQIELVQSLANAFAIAYARYEDFNKLEKAKERVEDTLNALKATQNQLVQSEKMASLGELTAGIAHEIQNPLNFVNNFSEVSVELIEEMQEEVKKGDLEEAMAIMEDIKQNLDKINHHGKRADGIVKGMLQHSRASSGEKSPTDINVLADEYLRLAYHGLRAKDKSFNATLETHFDDSIGKVNIMGQDMGRVILNLITNAFYAVKERKSQQPEGFEPTVTVTTRKEGNKVEVAVKDNGNGIPEAIREKIFQPFFTTKPTGQGTGLGLSMSYDIITKGHGGELKVATEEGQGTTFAITIPAN
jgi:signal transduction histidine kinase